MKITYCEKHTNRLGEWNRYVTLEDGRMFHVALSRGRSVRIPYKPRGQNVGHKWFAHVREVKEEEGKRFPTTVKRFPTLDCTKSTGAKGMLRFHGIII